MANQCPKCFLNTVEQLMLKQSQNKLKKQTKNRLEVQIWNCYGFAREKLKMCFYSNFVQQTETNLFTLYSHL